MIKKKIFQIHIDNNKVERERMARLVCSVINQTCLKKKFLKLDPTWPTFLHY